MKVARCALLIAVAMLGCVFASTANAQEEPVAFVEEPSGEGCSPCDIHLVGESHITALPSNVVVSRCEDEFVGQIYADGTGEVEYSGVDHGSPECAVHECLAEPSESHAPIGDPAETSEGTARFFIRFCVGGAAAEIHCDLEVALEPIASHSYALSTSSLCEGGARRFEGAWESEGTEFEVVHEEASFEVVSEEEPAEPCVAATANCEVQAEAESHLVALPSGIEVMSCEDVFHMEWNHDGTGHVHWTGLPHGGPGCTFSNCTVMSPEWPITGSTEIAPGTVRSNITLCLRTGTTEAECALPVDIAEGVEAHHYLLSTTVLCAGGSRRYEFAGETHLDVDGAHPIEFEHF